MIMTIWRYFARDLAVFQLFYFGILVTGQANLRLSSSNPLQGRVDIWHNGKWGTVCNHDGWGLEEATVVCRQLGLPDAQALSTTTQRFDTSGLPGWSLDIWLSNVQCTGQESSLEDCQGPPIGSDNSCNHLEDVIVVCALPGYIGCYGNIPSSWRQHVSFQQQLTVGSCLDTCRRQGYPVAALSEGKDCWCGNNGDSSGQELPPVQCDAPCNGNNREFCGGSKGVSSLYATDIGGAHRDSDILSRGPGSIASPSFPAPYTTSTEWHFNYFPNWVTIEFHLPFFNLNEQDRLVFKNVETGVPGAILTGALGEELSQLVIGPVRQLDVLLEANTFLSASGFIMFYEVSSSSAPTRPPPAPETPRPPRPATTTTPPPTQRPVPVTLPPRPQPTFIPKASTTEKPPKPITREPTTTQRKTQPPPPRITTRTTKETIKQSDRPQPVRTSRQPVRTTEETVTSSRRLIIDWWFEVWTFICVAVFVVGVVLICFMCWKSGQWKWLKKPRRRHHRRHRRHSSHSSWSSTWAPSTSSRGSMTSNSHSSDSPYKMGSTQYLIDPNHSYPGVIYHEGYPGQGHVAYPISVPLDDPAQDPIIPQVEIFDPCPLPPELPIPPPDTVPLDPIEQDPIIPQVEVFDPCPFPNEPSTSVPQEPHLDCVPPPAPPPPPPIGLAVIPEASPMHPQDGGCSAYDYETRQADQHSLHLDPDQSSPPLAPEGFINHDVEAIIVVTQAETEVRNKESTRKDKKSKHKRKSESSNKNRKSEERFKLFGFGKSKHEKPQVESHRPPVIPEHVKEDVCGPSDILPTQPVVVIEDDCGPNDFVIGHPNPPYLPDEVVNDDIIVPEVEPYIMTETHGTDYQERSSESENTKSGIGSRIFSFGKSKNNDSQEEPNRTTQGRPIAPEHVIEDDCGPNDFQQDSKEKSKKKSKKPKKKKKSKHPDRNKTDTGISIDTEIDAVISGLDQSIQQAEKGAVGTSVSAYSDLHSPGPYDFGNPVYASNSQIGFPDKVGGNRQQIPIASLADTDSVFVVVQAVDGNRVDVLPPPDGRAPPMDFILPGEGTDDLPEDLDMFGSGVRDNYIPPPPPGTPPPPPGLVGLF